MLKHILVVTAFAIASSMAIAAGAQQPPSASPLMPPRGIPQSASEGSVKIDGLMDSEFQRGFRLGMQVQAEMEAQQQKINDLSVKCGDRCDPPKPKETPASPKVSEKK